ncbi:hypothetical protein PIB30_086610 [Stylosanthes scabra]|uniref:C2 NT-type domain-containing protein n=1 Tax=Stylosanthes scabra TaxID=79078 RepID=A0ABU6QSR1_9FABA|nr:hypothetical protein [Stylosanthes scabra]
MNMKMKMKRQNKDKYVVKVNQLKLELGTFGTNNNVNNMVIIQVRGTASQKVKAASSSSIWKSILLPFLHGTRKLGYTHNTSIKRFLISSEEPATVTWEARDLCGFQLRLRDKGSVIGACHMEFHVLYGEGDAKLTNNMELAGKVSMDVTMEEITKSNCQLVHKTLPIQLKVHGLNIKATLSVSLSIMDLRNFHDYLPRTFENIAELDKKQSIIEMVEFDQTTQPNPYESDDSNEFDSDESSVKSTTSSSSDGSSSNESHYAGSRVNSNVSMLPWSRSFKECWRSITAKKKQETLTSHLSSSMGWEYREVESRDGNSKLKTNVLFSSFHQRSKEASGDSACSALAVFIAHWLLHSKKDLPTRSQFDRLITQGSSEWRRLCKIGAYLKLFPDKHFDLETILEANLRPLIVRSSESYTRFFAPEKFRCLQGAMSFDEIWDEISKSDEPRVYIVSWKDHFFVLKVEEDAYYIIDTLGERLFHGCKRAFILKFDSSSLMHSKVEKVENENENGNDPSKKIVCSGKECCKEFIKLFHAAIPVRQLEEEESKGNVSTTNSYLHRFLQIDLHFCSSYSLY